ncbi:calcium-activated outward-rectifying potassium channel 5 family protein [Hibiscus syriacus]|uniref:Calcium-activated outward-rectifying potassium channel 5 family protein n=1 Tax=Hibiscus syriacus TaxID=106335 RepID=A0A6A2WFS6_HIBSY|nr:calcium-activated outward-rectifying potassium channel 5 family protein [Hibiscus syriacus]
MLKNGNFDTTTGLCPENGKKSIPPFTTKRFPCYGKGCMNQPTLNHQPTQLLPDGTMRGWFNGTYDIENFSLNNLSFYELPESDFKVKFRLEVKKGGGPKSQFYLLDIGSCWKNSGDHCDGDVLTDVTRYSEMIINPDTSVLCSPTALGNCPPYHITHDDRKIYRNDTVHFPYGAYHYYCAPGNAQHLEQPVSLCDPYSNPQAQEIVQLLPHPIWGQYGYPTEKGHGWVGDPRTWVLDTGGLASRLYFYQDPDTPPAKRIWTSIDMALRSSLVIKMKWRNGASVTWMLFSCDSSLVQITKPRRARLLTLFF